MKPFHIEFNGFFAIIKLIFSDTNFLSIFIDCIYKIEVELVYKPSSVLSISKFLSLSLKNTLKKGWQTMNIRCYITKFLSYLSIERSCSQLTNYDYNKELLKLASFLGTLILREGFLTIISSSSR